MSQDSSNSRESVKYENDNSLGITCPSPSITSLDIPWRKLCNIFVWYHIYWWPAPSHFDVLQCRYGERVILIDLPTRRFSCTTFYTCRRHDCIMLNTLNRAQSEGFLETWEFYQDCAFTRVRRRWFVCSLHHWSETGMFTLSDTLWAVWGWCYMHMILCW